MAYDIRMVKLVSGETVIGKFSSESKTLNDPAIIQTIPVQQGVQMMLLPYGYPFDNEFTGTISFDHVIYSFNNVPEDLKTKYMEACSNLTLSSGGLGGLDLQGGSASGLLRGK